MKKPVIKTKNKFVKPIEDMVKLEEGVGKRVVKKTKKLTKGKIGKPRD